MTLTLTGTVAPGDVFVFGSTAAGGPLGALLDQVTTASLWNGDDAIVLTRTDGTVVDSFGQVGVDPGQPSTVAGKAVTRIADHDRHAGGVSCISAEWGIVPS